jgi:cell wall-associated NlpC family hydrolase
VSELGPIVSRWVGSPWERCGLDCWEFVRVVYSEAYHIQLPPYAGVDSADRSASAAAVEASRSGGDWRPVSAPSDGDAVVMGLTTRPHHVGIWIAEGPGLVAHNAEGRGVCVQPLRLLRAMGWHGFNFYRHRDRHQ